MNALAASDGRRRKRKRDTTPDAIGMSLKRDLLAAAAHENPPADQFESWLLARVIATPAGGPIAAMAAEILDEYRLAAADPAFAGWLASGAVSDDAAASPN